LSALLSNVERKISQTDHWHQLAILLRQEPDVAQSLLRRPPPPGIPTERSIADITASARQQNLTELLAKHLLSGFLLTPEDRQPQWPISAADTVEDLFSGTGQKILQALSWIQIPILAVQGTRGRIIFMMSGLLPDSSGCYAVGQPTPDSRTADAVSRACRVGGWEQGVVYWFLQPDDEQPVQGNSLGLPIALGLDLLLASVSWPEGLYATGGLDPDGTIVPVDHILEKYRSAAFSCRLFLAPADSALPRDPARPIHGCADFDDACFTARLYSNGISAADILLYQACWISERNFFYHFHELPPAMLTSDRARYFYQQVQAEPDIFLELLGRSFSKCSHDQLRGKIMADLFSPENIQALATRSSSHAFAAFNWCLAVLAFHNHCGQVSASRSWRSCAETLRSMVDLKEINRFINHSFVDRRFNRYDFRPDPTPELAAVLKQEENKQKVYPGSNGLLGSLYGTLAQNFGFCGPAHLASLLEMTDRSRQAFGRKYQLETQRLINYEIYAFLDSARLEDAVQLTAKYLGLDASSRPEDWFKQMEVSLFSEPFKAALVLRLLSEIGYTPAGSWITGSIPLICRHHGHPWQLIALNLGRMAVTAHRLEDGELLLRHSLRICQADSETMLPMGLLALAELHAAALARAEDYSTARAIRIWLKETTYLNGDHFQPILELTAGEELLDEVKRKRSRLFPFSYR
jgi:hypothetical protein